jgi:hypothetical protein
MSLTGKYESDDAKATKIQRANDMRLNRGKIFLLSTNKPQVDGVYILDLRGENPRFEMLASPFAIHYNEQILKQPGGIDALVNFVSNMLGGDIDAKAVKSAKTKKMADVSDSGKIGFGGYSSAEVVEKPSLIIKGQFAGNKHITFRKTIYFKALNDSNAKYTGSKLDDKTIIKLETDSNRKPVSELSNNGWFRIVDGTAIFYITIAKKAEERIIYPMNEAAKELIDSGIDSNKMKLLRKYAHKMEPNNLKIE